MLRKTLVKNSIMRMPIIEIMASEFLSSFSLTQNEEGNKRRKSANSYAPRLLQGIQNRPATKSLIDVSKLPIHISYKAGISSKKNTKKPNSPTLG